MDAGRTANYGYDSIGRLISASTNGSTAYPKWGISDTYDRFGNRWSQTGTAGTVPTSSLTFGSSGMNSSTNNRPTGYTYDAGGNLTVEPLAPPDNYTYDGENQMVSFSGGGGTAAYSYDGNGMRVKKAVTSGTTSVSIFSGSSVIAEYDNGAAPTAPSREYIYSSSKLLAMISGATTTYYHADELSARLTSDGTTGNIVTQEGHFPFGEKWYQVGPANSWFFTSYDRDAESGLDYALARYYNSRTGTFCSADPVAGRPADPQTWNRYSYGRNDPVDRTDPSGKFFGILLAWLAQYIVPTVFETVTVTAEVAPGPLTIASEVSGALLPAAIAPALPGAGGGPPNKGVQWDDAKKMAQQKDCNAWLTKVAKKALSDINVGSGAAPDSAVNDLASQEVNSIPNTLDNVQTIPKMLDSGIADSGKTVVTARADFVHQTMTLYSRFYKTEFRYQTAQILVHEAMHLVTRLGDVPLAHAATGKVYGTGESESTKASTDFQNELKNNCK